MDLTEIIQYVEENFWGVIIFLAIAGEFISAILEAFFNGVAKIIKAWRYSQRINEKPTARFDSFAEAKPKRTVGIVSWIKNVWQKFMDWMKG